MNRSLCSVCVPILLLGIGATSCGGGGGGGGGGKKPPQGGAPPPASNGDLELLAVSVAPLVLEAGETLTVTDEVKNHGPDPLLGVSVGVYLSGDAVVDANDTLLGFRGLAALAPGETSLGAGSLTVPVSTLPGTWFLVAKADHLEVLAESSENNNALVAPATLQVLPPVRPNLVPTDLAFHPLFVRAGEAVDVSDTVSNDGVEDAGGFQVGIYLSTDSMVDASDRLLGVRAVADLSVGASSSAADSLTIPTDLPTGSYWLGVVADDLDQLSELDEGDNALAASVPLTVEAVPAPDLRPTAGSFQPTLIDAGSTFLVSDELTNEGSEAAGTFRVGIYLSDDILIDASDRLVGVRTVDSLNPGALSVVSSSPVDVPITTPGGSYYVGLVADYQDDVVEGDELDNTLVFPGKLEVVVPPTPDLLPASVSFSPAAIRPDQGELLSVSESVLNQGVVGAGPFRVAVYLSTNPDISSADILIDERTVASLAVGATSGSSFDLSLPSNVGAGTWYVGVLADDLGAVLEIDTTNNGLLASSTLDVLSAPTPMVDLLVENVAFDPKTITPGQTLQVQKVVRNAGDLSAGAFRVGIYLSQDETISESDLLLGLRQLSQLGVGFSSASSAPYVIPAGTAAGTWFVGVIADVDGGVVESDKTNNTGSALGGLTVL